MLHCRVVIVVVAAYLSLAMLPGFQPKACAVGESPSDADDPALNALRDAALESTTEANKAMAELAAKQYGDTITSKAKFNEDIAAARQRFWAAYPNSPDLPAARAALDQLLWEKDNWYLQACLSAPVKSGGRNVAVNGEAMRFADIIALGQLDDGIPKSVQGDFADWVQSVSDHLAIDTTSFTRFQEAILSGKLAKAVGESEASYGRYSAQRAWSEFDRAGRELPGTDNPAVYIAYLCSRYEKLPLDEAIKQYRGMAAALGADELKSVAAKLHAAKKNAQGEVMDLSPFGLVPYQLMMKKTPSGNQIEDPGALAPAGVLPSPRMALHVLVNSVARKDGRRYILAQMANSNTGVMSPGDKRWYGWDVALKQYALWETVLGKDAVARAAAAVQAAPKHVVSGNIDNPSAIGATEERPMLAFRDVLLSKDPKNYVRVALATSRNLDTTAAIDAAYAKFVSEHGGEAGVLDAATRLMGPQAAPWSANEIDRIAGVADGTITLRTRRQRPAPPPAPAAAQLSAADQLWEKYGKGTILHYKQDWYKKQSGSDVKQYDQYGPAGYYVEIAYDGITNGKPLFYRAETAFYAADPQRQGERREEQIASYPHGPQQGMRYRSVGKPVVTSGNELLTALGRKIKCHWECTMTQEASLSATPNTVVTTIWTSDEIPGGYVRSVRETRRSDTTSFNEEMLQSIDKPK